MSLALNNLAQMFLLLDFSLLQERELGGNCKTIFDRESNYLRMNLRFEKYHTFALYEFQVASHL